MGTDANLYKYKTSNISKSDRERFVKWREQTYYKLNSDDKKWNEFTAKKRFANKKEADKVSYFVDKFVENELLINITPYREELAKQLLSFDRLERRSIGESYFDFYNLNAHNTGLYFGRRLLDLGRIGVLFTSYTKEMTEEMFNTLNTLAVESFNVYTKYKYPNIILISTNENHFLKFGFIKDIKPYPKEYEELVKKDITTLGWFTDLEEGKFKNKEFPE